MRLTTLCLCLAACAAPRAAPTPPPRPAPVDAAPDVALDATPDDASPDVAAPDDLCARALAPHRAAVAAFAEREAYWREPFDSFGRCLPTPAGAWVVSLEALARVEHDEGGTSVRGRWVVAHVSRDGAVARQAHDSEWTSHDTLLLTGVDLADYDGDGAPELVARWRSTRREWADAPGGAVLTLRDGAVQPYAPAAGIAPEDARDVDGDGRLDLVVRAPYEAEGDDYVSGMPYLMQGPPLLAHALPDGRFSRDDAVAAAFAREACPRRVPAVFGAEPSAAQVACARLWGVATTAVTRAVRARCASVAEMGTGNPRRPHCGDVRVLARWAAATAPLALR